MTEGFTTIANDIIDSGKLDPYQGWILLRIARRGVCFESQRSMAEGANMSLGKVNGTIKWLHENGYIEQKEDKRYGRIGWSVVLPDEQTQQNDVLPDERFVSPHEQDVLPDEHLVLPDERHLNKTKLKRPINKTKEKEGKERPQNAFWLIPENLRDDDFIKLWSLWLEHVDAARLTFTEPQAAVKLAELADAGLAMAINSVKVSLFKGWKNIYITDESVGSNGRKNGYGNQQPSAVPVLTEIEPGSGLY